jgi:rhodanese-related sulfurtransferase
MIGGHKVTKEAVYILLTALALSVGAYALRPNSMTPQAGGPPEAGLVPTGDVAAAIDFAAAVEHFNNRTAIFADARSEEAYRNGHIEGALHLDPHQFDGWSERVFAQIDAESIFITYCDGGRCTLGLELAEKLAWLGYENVYYLKNGWSLWTVAQMPIGKGQP